jgi:hypothetical protein
MSWRVEWKALSDEIQGLLDAGNFYLQCKAIRSDDSYRVAGKQLLPQAAAIFSELESFQMQYQSALPPKASACLKSFIQTFKSHFTGNQLDGQSGIQVRLTALASFRSELAYHLSDFAFVAKRLSERAFVHLRRSIVADSDLREKWKRAFEKGELACEKLGGSHLLLHGIWAFKVDAQGGRTDLILGEPITDIAEAERSSEALVLTEWKVARSGSDVGQKLSDAKIQASKYSGGVLAGFELTRYRYLVVVTERDAEMPPDDDNGDVAYRKINIPVDPRPPSKAN